MKKILKWRNLGWILAIILFLILISKGEKEDKITENNLEKLTPTEIVTPTESIKNDLFLVTKVIDGDTIMVKINNEEKSIRLIGINTPETNECFGKEATERMKELVENKKVKLEADGTQDDKDKYDRLLRYIYLEDGTFVNEQLIKDGLAKEYTYKIAYKFQIEFKSDQKSAEEEKIGLWTTDVCKNLTTVTPTKTILTTENLNYSCDCSKSCTEINSCEEAYYQLNNCGCSKRDSDGDGVPCESLCN